MVFLPTGDAPAAFGFRYRNAKGFQRFQRHINIALGFDFFVVRRISLSPSSKGSANSSPVINWELTFPGRVYTPLQLALQRNGKVVAVCLTAMPCHLIQQKRQSGVRGVSLAFKAAVLSNAPAIGSRKRRVEPLSPQSRIHSCPSACPILLSICLSNPIRWTGGVDRQSASHKCPKVHAQFPRQGFADSAPSLPYPQTSHPRTARFPPSANAAASVSGAHRISRK